MDVSSSASTSRHERSQPPGNAPSAPRWTIPLQTSAGEFVATLTERGLAELDFPQDSQVCRPSKPVPPPIQSWADLTKRALERCLAGEPLTPLPPLDWSGRTEFQQHVWRALQNIPLGETATYGEIAEHLSIPGGARAVGAACGANPIPVLVPCHRVLATGGKLGGFSGGLDWKRKLLAIERAGLGPLDR